MDPFLHGSVTFGSLVPRRSPPPFSSAWERGYLVPRPSHLFNVTRIIRDDACNIEKVGGPGDEAMTLEPSSSTSTILPTIKTSPHH